MRRLAALAAAVAMVAGAWALRDAVAGDDGSGGDGGDAPEQLRLRCATELSDVCDRIVAERRDVTLSVEDPGATADALAELPAGDDPGFDLWLADGPWAAMSADDRSFAGTSGEVLGEPSEVLGRSPSVIVVQEQRSAGLADACGGTITWSCVGEQTDTLRVGLAAPDRGDGLVTSSAAVADRLGSTGYSSVDFEEAGFTTWFAGLTDLSTRTNLGGQSPLAAALTRAGTFNLVGALEAQSSTLLRDRQGWVTIYPDPMTTADVQLVARSGIDLDEALDRLDPDAVRDALAAEGWRIDGAAPEGAGDAPPLPEGANLPGPGVLNALADLW